MKKTVKLLFLLITVSFFALRFGSTEMTIEAFIGGLLKKEIFQTESIILYSVRLPRVFGGLLAGSGLSMSGVLLQKVTGNNMASPNIIGVNAGAGFFMIMMLFFFPNAVSLKPFGAFLGAFLTGLLIITIASKTSLSKSGIILAGIAVTALLNSAISFMSYFDTDLLADYNAFSVGGVMGVHIEELFIPAIIISVSFIASLILSEKTDILCLGDSLASSLGINVKALRIAVLAISGALAASVVSFAGLLGFVGLAVPHFARKITDGSTKEMLPISAVLGSILLISGDLLGRILFAPSEIPVGIVMAFMGAPFLFCLLLRGNRNVGV